MQRPGNTGYQIGRDTRERRRKKQQESKITGWSKGSWETPASVHRMRPSASDRKPLGGKTKSMSALQLATQVKNKVKFTCSSSKLFGKIKRNIYKRGKLEIALI